MAPKTLLRTAVAAALLATGLAAQAGTLAMSGWLFGSGNSVAVSTPAYSGLAGGFKGTLSGMSDPAFDLNPVEMYCVDLAQTINISTSYSVKLDGETGTTAFTIVSASSHFSSAISTRLAQLVSYAESLATIVDSSSESTSMQLAIWNTLYDTDNTLSAPGTFSAGSNTITSYANTLLANSVGFGVTKQLYVLKSGSSQDQLFWVTTPPGRDLPEPASLALVGLALGGAAFASRRRRA